jgi:hypothetical protein
VFVVTTVLNMEMIISSVKVWKFRKFHIFGLLKIFLEDEFQCRKTKCLRNDGGGIPFSK